MPDGLRELSHGPFVWAVDNQSFVDGSNCFFVITEFNCIHLGNVHVNQKCLLVIRLNDNHSPGPVIREVSP